MTGVYRLTEEGKIYLENGLPEKQLYDLVKERELKIEEAKTLLERKKIDLNVALQWAKKLGLIMITGGRIQPLKGQKTFEEQNALEKISKGENVDEKMLKVLVQRKLIIKEKDDALKKAEQFIGKEVANIDPSLIKTGLWKQVKLKSYNAEAIGTIIHPGKLQFYSAFLEWIQKKLTGLGFEEMRGPIMETEFWNMDALYMPQFHAARDIHDAFFVKNPSHAKSLDKNILNAVKESHEKGVSGSKGWEYQYDVKRAHRHVLRTQGTVLSAKTLASKPNVPGKYYSIARCFRYDVVDATHAPDFYQVEGIILSEDINVRHLVGVLKMFAKEFAETETIKIVPGYFPFTEPSFELHAKHKSLGWTEIGGAGLFRPEMTTSLGVGVPVIAWGLGIDRIFMVKMGISDIRELFTHDIERLRKAPVVY